jgi:hypothetical protein
VSAVCETFGVPPDVAERQPWVLTRAVLDYRNAKSGLDLINGERPGFDELAKHPGTQDLLVEMLRAQGVVDERVPMADVLASLRTVTDDEEKEE